MRPGFFPVRKSRQIPASGQMEVETNQLLRNGIYQQFPFWKQCNKEKKEEEEKEEELICKFMQMYCASPDGWHCPSTWSAVEGIDNVN